jgi:predicted nucleotidyltransferase component of viral defense system
MKTITGIYTALLVLGLLCLSGIAAAQQDDNTTGTLLTDDIQPYNGPIGADSPLYGLKLALEDMDESFTANETERVNKQMGHAQLRLSEVRRSLELNQSDSAEQALNNYWMKMNLTNVTLTRWGSNATGLLHAEEMIVKHQFVLENLMANHPNNTGLQRAYNNSRALENKFAEKTAVMFQRTLGKDNKTILHAIRLEQKENNRRGTIAGTVNPVTNVTMQEQSGTQQQGQGQGHQQDNNGNGNSVDKGKGTSKNK